MTLRAPITVLFTLNAKVLDDGQQVVSLTLDTTGMHVDASSLSMSTFTVHAEGANPHTLLDSATLMGTFDVDRTVTGVRLDHRGRIVIDLAHGHGTIGAPTYGWAASEGRDFLLDLTYTVTQQQPIKLTDGTTLTFSSLEQGRVVDPEGDCFGSGRSDGLAYRLFEPELTGRGDRPLIVWLHGGGQGGWSGAANNDMPLIANRGALGFATPEAQRVFDGAFVLAPQATTAWLDDRQYGYSTKLMALIERVSARRSIARTRILLAGASNGGFMTMKLVADNPTRFAAAVPICPPVAFEGATRITDHQLTLMRKTPTWIVQAVNDPMLPFELNGQHAYDVLGNALLTAYPDVTYDGVTYDGHWSWIYVAHNHPVNDAGQHVWEWMADQRLQGESRW